MQCQIVVFIIAKFMMLKIDVSISIPMETLYQEQGTNPLDPDVMEKMYVIYKDKEGPLIFKIVNS